MVDIDPVQGAGGAGGIQPGGQKSSAKSTSGVSFDQMLRQAQESQSVEQAIQDFVRAEKGEDVKSINLIKTFDGTSDDESVFDVESVEGKYWIVKNRHGGFTLFQHNPDFNPFA